MGRRRGVGSESEWCGTEAETRAKVLGDVDSAVFGC